MAASGRGAAGRCPAPAGWESAEEVPGLAGLAWKRVLRPGRGAPCADAVEALVAHSARVAGRRFAPREATFCIGLEGPGLPFRAEALGALLRTMRPGERAEFWAGAALAGGGGSAGADAPWSEGGFEWVEEGYEWEAELRSCSPARLAPSARLALRGPGPALPLLGLGVYMASADGAYSAALEALRIGYRLVDTASMYQNEAAVGAAVRASGVKREEVIVVSKVNNPDHGYHEALRAVDRSRRQLGVGHIDLMLIHSPLGGRLVETWDALLEARERGWVTRVGVSNFGAAHLRGLAEAGREPPCVNQVELSPFCQERALRALCRRQGVAMMGYSPLTRGQRLADPRVARVARKHGRSAAQVLIRWAIQQGVVSIPKTVRRERLEENLGAFQFSLDGADLEALAACEEGLHTCWDCLEEPWTG